MKKAELYKPTLDSSKEIQCDPEVLHLPARSDRPALIMKTSARDKLPSSKGKAESHTRVRKQNGFICHPFNTTVSRTFDTCDVWSTCSRAGATDTLTFPTGRPTVGSSQVNVVRS
ncbi:hypothetical protein Bbelb_440910, partial [Branchiostoma belcheri]